MNSGNGTTLTTSVRYSVSHSGEIIGMRGRIPKKVFPMKGDKIMRNRDAIPYIATRCRFSASNFFGTYECEGYGKLYGGYWNEVDAATYIVYSYHTPIAWHIDGYWTIPDEQYSPATSRHQSIVKEAMRKGDYNV